MKFNKQAFKTKEFWAGAFALAVSMFPEAQDFIAKHPEEVAQAFGLLSLLFGFKTKSEK